MSPQNIIPHSVRLCLGSATKAAAPSHKIQSVSHAETLYRLWDRSEAKDGKLCVLTVIWKTMIELAPMFLTLQLEDISMAKRWSRSSILFPDSIKAR